MACVLCSAVSGFDWEEHAESITGFNVGARAQAFVNEVRNRATAYRTNHLLVP